MYDHLTLKQKMAAAAKKLPARPPLPRLRADNVEDYLDWLMRNGSPQEVENGLRAVELVVRLRMGEAQAKTTHAQLIEQGVVDPGAAKG